MAGEEQKIKKAIKQYIEEHNGYWSSVQGGPYSKPGDPDIICFFGDGRWIGIEAKTPTGVQSPIQKQREREIERKGGIYLLIRSVQELNHELRRRGIIQD